MTFDLALEYIPKRMKELGYDNNYHIRFRHFRLKPAEEKSIQASGQLFILVEPPNDVKVQSDMGIFDYSEFLINEMQYEHEGTITITNQTALMNHVRFIQVLPQNAKTTCLLVMKNTMK